MNVKNEKGVTLLILIVTIIILLILASVTVTVVIKANFMNKAGETQGKTQNLINNQEGWSNDIINQYENNN